MRLIDADKFFENFPELAIEPYINAPTVVKDYDTGYQDGLEDGLNDIRPQGEWILPNFYGDGVSYECNKCHIPHEGYIGKDDKPHGYDFCPNCGADMRGDKK